MRYLVTGGAGFIGSHLVERLVSDGHEVRVVDDLSSGSRANLADLEVELAVRDLASDALDDLVRGIDGIFHLAAIGSVPRSVAAPLPTHNAAATATLRLLIAARDAGVGTFVNSSSSSVYGNVAEPPMREAMPTLPRSPYAVAKLAAEGYTRVFAQLHGMRTVSLRYFNVFGPRQDPRSQYAAALPRFVEAYAQRRRPVVFADGRQSRDFTYVDNVVLANVLAATAPSLSGESVNIAAGQPHSVLELLEAIAAIFGYVMEPEFAPDRPGDIRHSHADISLARTLVGFEPVVPFHEGLRPTVQWLRERTGAA